MKIKTIVLAAGAALLFATPARAQGWGEVVVAQLEAVTEALGQGDVVLAGRPMTGGLDDNSYEDVTVNLRDPGVYLIVGVCDQDCTDLDLELYDGRGSLLDSDVATDDVPVVAVEVQRPGNFRLRVKMIRCSIEPCNYGIGIYTS